MITSSENMFWGDINDITRFCENTGENKDKRARKTSSIILAGVQLMENFIKGLKNMSAYDAASTIISDANWIKNSSRSDFLDETGKKVVVSLGSVYYIDYGKTFYQELAYFHHGLCVGKKEGKILIIPMTSGTKYFSSCYHPINNPMANKKYRQALLSEGFEKDCVLKMNDAKFISPGRIVRETISINSDVLLQIQEQLFSIQFPVLYQKYINYMKSEEKNKKQISEQKQLISNLKQENNNLKMKLRRFT